MDYDNLIERLRGYCQEWEAYSREQYRHDLEDAATDIETLRADLSRVTAELNDLRAQWDMYGGDVGITETFKELERAKAERDAAKSQEVIEAVDELVEFARTRMRTADWLYYSNVLGEWRGIKED